MKALIQELSEAIEECERTATTLSQVLNKFDLSNIPYCEKDLNQADVGSKIITAKFLLSIGYRFSEGYYVPILKKEETVSDLPN